MDFWKKISSLKVRSVAIGLACLWAFSFAYSYFFAPRYKFFDLSQENVDNQWENIEALMVSSRHHKIPMLLFDIDILPNIFIARDKAWKDALHQCKTLCKHHPEEKNVITFAAVATEFMAAKDEYIKSLEHLGFTVHLTEALNPRRNITGKRGMIPSYLWMARRNHVIHLAFLHERGEEEKYMWIGSVNDRSWLQTVKAIAPAIGEGWHSLKEIGAKFPRYAQAYDLSHRFTGLPIYLDGLRISVPYHIKAFLEEYHNSRFIECNYHRADQYIKEYQKKVHRYDRLFQHAAKKMLLETKKALDALQIRFWLTGGTLLGWFRQCGIIPHDINVDIAVWGRDYKHEIINGMQERGFFFKSRYGKASIGMEMAFLDKAGNRINIHFFKMYRNVAENLRTRSADGMRFLFTYDSFRLCWTEFVGMKVQVPCETLEYITSYFGDEWDKPAKDWLWHMNARNFIPIGEWDKRELKEAMEIHYRRPKKAP